VSDKPSDAEIGEVNSFQNHMYDYPTQELIYLEAAQWFKLKVCVAEENRNRSSSAAFNSAPVLA